MIERFTQLGSLLAALLVSTAASAGWRDVPDGRLDHIAFLMIIEMQCSKDPDAVNKSQRIKTEIKKMAKQYSLDPYDVETSAGQLSASAMRWVRPRMYGPLCNGEVKTLDELTK